MLNVYTVASMASLCFVVSVYCVSICSMLLCMVLDVNLYTRNSNASLSKVAKNVDINDLRLFVISSCVYSLINVY